MTGLNQRLLDAHAADDRRALVALYREAADRSATEGARGFYLTQSYVFALDTGHPDADALRDILRQMGREE